MWDYDEIHFSGCYYKTSIRVTIKRVTGKKFKGQKKKLNTSNRKNWQGVTKYESAGGKSGKNTLFREWCSFRAVKVT